jgi:hypothetical protein
MMDANISLGPGTGDLKMGRFGITLSDPTSSYFLCLSQDMIWTSLSSVNEEVEYPCVKLVYGLKGEIK